MSIKKCSKCGFILGTRPGLKEIEGVCLACINIKNKFFLDFEGRQAWLTDYIQNNITNNKYDCVIAVSGGKDSHMIITRLVENHGVHSALLVTCGDDYTLSQAGFANRKNIAEVFGFDHIIFRNNPKEFREKSLHGFETNLNPQAWFEATLYKIPIEIAKMYGIKLVFFGENSAYEYGASTELNIFHPLSTHDTHVIFLGAIYPYSISDSLEIAKRVGFKDLTEFNDWYRTGGIEFSTQIDSLGNMVDIWCKFPKFGFQRASDIACRLVREGTLLKDQAELLIRDNDYILDPKAKYDFCKVLGITEKYFYKTVDRFVNSSIVKKDVNGIYRRVDFL